MSKQGGKKKHHNHGKKEYKKCYYEVLQVYRNAPVEVIKQSYKKLALKYHPDKNEDKETSKKMFTEISEAYTVLIDPKKREMYDTLGHVDDQGLDFDTFDLFTAGHFKEFESFIDEMMGFPDLDDLAKMFSKANVRKGGARRAKHAAASRNMKKMFEDEYEKKPKKASEPKTKEDEDWYTYSDENDEWESDSSGDDAEELEANMEYLFTEEMMFPLFVSEHSDILKGKKKGLYRCGLDKYELNEKDLFDHFDACHRKEYKKWCKDAVS